MFSFTAKLFHESKKDSGVDNCNQSLSNSIIENIKSGNANSNFQILTDFLDVPQLISSSNPTLVKLMIKVFP